MATYKKLLKNRAGDTIIPVTDADTYSTTEKKVGVWIDGKPIYRRVLTLPGITGGTEYTIDIGVLSSNISNFWVKNGSVRISGTGILPILFYNRQYADRYSTWAYVSLNATNATVHFKCDSTITGGNIIIEYTKTTD
jgi:hypothetical protein